ncbi:MAG: isochorismatase family protein [Chlamydiales bacterium]|jgi:nicotinamidase-related amidase
MSTSPLAKFQTALLVIDMQDKVFSTVDHGAELLASMLKLVQGFQILQIPILISEQFPQGLGETIWPIKNLLGIEYKPWIKTAFCCLDDPAFSRHVHLLPIQQWVVVGIEAHICVLQTAKSLVKAGKEVVVLNDAISSRSIFDFSTAIAEMRDEGIRISSVETVLFELLKDSRAPEFKAISQLIKASCEKYD